MRALYSKTWQLREAALISIEKVLKGGGVEGHKGDLLKALSRALSKTVQDKVANVFHNTLQVGSKLQLLHYEDDSTMWGDLCSHKNKYGFLDTRLDTCSSPRFVNSWRMQASFRLDPSFCNID